MDFENTRPDVPSDAILADLRRVAGELGTETVPQNRYRELGQFSSTVVKKRFGSWNAALVAAGLAVNGARRDIPDDDLFDNLRAAWIALGRQPRRGEMQAPVSHFGHSAYVRRFGSWLAAMRSFADTQGTASNVAQTTAAAPDPATSRQPSLRLRFQVMQRDGFRCANCGRSPATHPGLVLHLEHVIPFSKGGRTELGNLRTACTDCNLGKGDTW